MERLILTLSAGVPDNADHLVSRGRKDMTIFAPIQPVIYKIGMPDLHLFKPNYSSASFLCIQRGFHYACIIIGYIS